jgi:hypothetical protein
MLFDRNRRANAARRGKPDATFPATRTASALAVGVISARFARVSRIASSFKGRHSRHREIPISASAPARRRQGPANGCIAVRGLGPRPPLRPGLRKSRGAADGGVILPFRSIGPLIGASKPRIRVGPRIIRKSTKPLRETGQWKSCFEPKERIP